MYLFFLTNRNACFYTVPYFAFKTFHNSQPITKKSLEHLVKLFEYMIA